jgi:hypothetical protein
MARFAAAKDRLDVMLFVVMSMSPMLQQYGSLDAKQKAGLGRAAPAAQKQPPLNASPPANAVFVNGALAIPGAPTNTDPVPAEDERQRFGLEGLLPPSAETLERQVERVLGVCAENSIRLDPRQRLGNPAT